MMNINHILNHTTPHEYLAENWTQQAFAAQTFALAHHWQQRRISAVALYCEDAGYFASALFAAWQAQAEVYLLPDNTEHNLAWAKQQQAYYLDDAIYERDISQMLVPSHPVHFTLSEHSRLLLKTSGSSGEAKIISKTLAQMQTEAEYLSALFPSDKPLAVCGSVSVQHLYGLTFRIFLALRNHWTIVRQQHRYPESLLAYATKHDCIWISSPALLNRLSQQIPADFNGHNIHYIVSAGGMLPETTAQNLAQRFGFYPIDVYGSSETGVIATRQGTTHWQLLPAVSITPHTDGIDVQSPWSDGKQHSADQVDIQGNTLILHGRQDRIIKLEDKRVSLNQLEQSLLQHEWINDVHCCLHPQHNRLAAWLGLSADGIEQLRNKGRKYLIQQLKSHLRNQFEALALPRYWRFTTELPRNTQSKIAQHDVQQAFLQVHTTPNWQMIQADHENHQYTFAAHIPLDLCYFAGHFAEFPLVPGVIEIQWAREVAAQFAWGQSAITHLENLKYQHFIRPNDHIVLQLQWDKNKNKIIFTFKNENKTCASGRMVMA